MYKVAALFSFARCDPPSEPLEDVSSKKAAVMFVVRDGFATCSGFCVGVNSLITVGLGDGPEDVRVGAPSGPLSDVVKKMNLEELKSVSFLIASEPV
jgi:hypothetical protein